MFVHSGTATYYSLLLATEKPNDVPRKATDKEYTKRLVDARARGALPLVQRDDDGCVGSQDDGDCFLDEGDVLSDDDAFFEVGEAPGGARAFDSEDDGLVRSDRSDEEPAGLVRPRAEAAAEMPPSAPPPGMPPPSSDGDEEPAEPPLVPRAVEESSGSSSSSTSSDDGDGIMGEDDVVDLAVPEDADTVVDGSLLKLDWHISKRPDKPNYVRFIIRCPMHPKCQKKRGLGPAQKARLGRFEPHAFVLAWRDDANLFEPGKHTRHRPCAASVAAAHRKYFPRGPGSSADMPP